MQIRSLRHVIIILALSGLLAAAFWGGYRAGAWQTQMAADRRAADDLGLLRQVRELLQTRFVGDIPDDRTQVYGAIRGLVGSYKDPYTTFLE
ncbi:MAG: hypothetical protein ACP5UQ_10865, partial [Anaerolineae bacterium]